MYVIKTVMNQYLQTEDTMAKAIRQAMREKKMPIMAECITIKNRQRWNKE
jgi:hypothetical protein